MASKRKRGDAYAESVKEMKPTVTVISAVSIDADFESAVAKVRNGSYKELSRISYGLLRQKDKKVAAADKHRKLQIKNINDLYEYEVQDANARYQRAYAETQERLIMELGSEVRRLKSKLQSAINATNNWGESGEASGGSKLSRTISSNSDEGYDENSLANIIHGEKDRASRRRLGASPNPPAALDPILPEECMRADFLEIVQDIQIRAAAFAKSAAKPLNNTTISITHEPSVLKVGTNCYSVGDLVVVFSVLSQETLSGVITTISDRDVVVRCGSGARISFLIGQLREGRVTISKDVASDAAAKLILEASA